MKHIKNSAIFKMMIVAILWSTGGILIKSLHLHPLAILSGRSLCALLLFIPYFIKRHPKTYLTSISKASYKHYLFSGFSLSALSLCFISATTLTTAAHAIVLQFSAPLWILIILWMFFGNKPNAKDSITVAIMLFSLIVFTYDSSGSSSILGNFFGILSGIFMAISTLTLKSKPIKDPLLPIILGNIINVLVGFPMLIGSLLSASSASQAPVNNSNSLFMTFILLLFIGLFQYGLSYLIYSKNIKSVSNINAILITTLEPLLNPLWVYLFIGETISALSMVGGFILIITIVLYNIHESIQPLANEI